MTRVGGFLAAAALVVATLPGAAGARPAQVFAGERIRAYDVAIDVLPSGRIHVVETIDYAFGPYAVDKHGIYRHIPVRFRYDGTHDRVYPLTGITVTGSPGTPVQTKVEERDGQQVIRIGHPDRTVTGDHRYVIAYDVDGALNRFEGHDELYWNAVGHQWPVPVQRVSVTVTAAASVGTVTCFAGPEGSVLACKSARARGRTARFTHGPLEAFSGVTVVAALPAGYAAAPGPVLKERWSANKAFSRSREAVGLALLVLVVGLALVARLAWRTGRDRRYAGLTPGLEPVAGQAVPEERTPLFGRGAVSVDFDPGDMKPAQMGVLLDESADPLDVTATIVDLAVRRFLTIEELPRKGLFRKRDWRLTRLPNPPGDPLNSWEGTLIRALFRSGSTVEVSDLKNEFHTHLARIQDDLYDDVVARGWFTRRPDRQRGQWFVLGGAAVAAGAGVTYVLARFTTFGLVGVACVLVGLVLLALHRKMPFRTARGTAALDRANAFRRYLVTAEADQLRFEEQEGVFARYLPYAVVLGETERWARAFRDLDARAQQELYWYAGPNGWSADDFTDSMSSFSTMTAGTLASTPHSAGGGSGFSGGSSGGGGGGGGGGSW